jgi:hypothetical protein
MPPSTLTGLRDRSLEVSAPSAYSVCGAHSTRTCLTRYVALSGFLNLLAPCFSAGLPAFFHAGNAHGVPTLQSFHPTCSRSPLSRSVPSCRYRCLRSSRLQGFRRTQSRRHVRRVRARRGSVLSWVSPSSGLSPHPRTASSEAIRP